MDIKDIRTRVDALDRRSYLVRRSAEPCADLRFSLLSKRVQIEVTKCRTHSFRHSSINFQSPIAFGILMIVGKWLKAAAMAFNLIYRFPEREEQASSVLKSVG